MRLVPTVKVNIPGSAAYDIIVEPGLLRSVGTELRRLSKSSKACVVTDADVGALHLSTLSDSLASAGIAMIVATVPPGETYKTIDTIRTIYDQLLPAKLDRSTPILSLGGGVVGDMTGFVAATILRGVPLIQVPTTLLAMVDASVGGKTGVNHAVGKNLIGAFHQPTAVLIDPNALTTLPTRQLQSGLAECIKHDIIRDAGGFAALERNIARAAAMDVEYLTQLIAHNVSIKARVVEADPFEQGERAHLNLGHTFGHAIETVSKYAYSHGESVAMGTCAAAHVAREIRLLSDGDYARILEVFRSGGLPTGGLMYHADQIVDAMAFDKKVRSGAIRLVLPDGIGRATIRDDVPRELMLRAVESLQDEQRS